MKERPILFSGAMVRALLDGSKTQTRRVVKKQAADWDKLFPEEGVDGREFFLVCSAEDPSNSGLRPIVGSAQCPYGQPGDRLYVRETWSQPAPLDPGPTVYRADYPACVPAHYTNLPRADEITWKPSIHMPRALSRILLEIVSVRVERLNDCSDADARAEGLLWDAMGWMDYGHTDGRRKSSSRQSYQTLWEAINGTGSWAVNPWVWVVEFKRVLP